MKKFAKVLLALMMIAAMVVPTSLVTMAAELSINQNGYYGNYAGTGCGFLDGNMYIAEGLKAANTSELTVTVNGKTAYFNNGYLGEKHCALREADYGNDGKVAGGWLQIGVVGADVVPGVNTMVVTDTEGNTVTLTFEATINALGTSYAKVVGDYKEKTMKAEIVFNTDPGFAIGTTFNGHCHDDHGSEGTFTVTAYDAATKMYTIESTNFVTTQSLLELQVTSEGDYNGYFVSATINEYNAKVADGGVVGTKVAISEISANRGDANNLIDGTDNKLESGTVPSASNPLVVNFKTAESFKLNTLILYTGNDDADWQNRAPKAFKVYGIAADGTETKLFETADAAMENKNFAPYAYNIDATTAYSSYKLEITDYKGAGYFQFGELEIYSDDVTITSDPIYTVKTGIVAYNGTAPVAAPDTNPPATEPDTTEPNPPVTEPGTSDTTGTDDTTADEAPDADDGEAGDEEGISMVWIIAGAAAVAAVAVVIVLVTKKKK